MKSRLFVLFGRLVYCGVWAGAAVFMGCDLLACVLAFIGALVTLLVTVFIFIPYGVLKVGANAGMGLRKETRRSGKVMFVHRYGCSVVFAISSEKNMYLSLTENPNIAEGNYVSFRAPDLYWPHLVECHDLRKIDGIEYWGRTD